MQFPPHPTEAGSSTHPPKSLRPCATGGGGAHANGASTGQRSAWKFLRAQLFGYPFVAQRVWFADGIRCSATVCVVHDRQISGLALPHPAVPCLTLGFAAAQRYPGQQRRTDV